MKTIKIFTMLVFVGLLFGLSSCAVHLHKDNGKHKGWNKNSNNPHHFKSTNPGKAGKKH